LRRRELSVTAVTARRLDVGQGGNVEVRDRFESIGGCGVTQALGESCEPVGILGLECKQFCHCISPALGPASAIGIAAHSGNCGCRRHQVADAVAGLTLGIAERLLAFGLTTSRHDSDFRYVTHCSGLPHLWVTRFSSRSAHGRRMTGSGGRGVSICPATWRHCGHPVPDTQRDHPAHRPHRNDAAPPSSGGNWNSPGHAAGCLPQRNSLPSAHMRCRITASLRATATRARAMPRRLATFMPQARSADHLVLRISNEWAAS